MKFDRRIAVPVGAAALLLAWWAASPRKPAPIVRAVIIPRGTWGAVPDQPGVPRTDAIATGESASGLEAPAPVLRHSAERRFSSPAGNGAADGGIAGAEAPPSSTTAASARLTGAGVNRPGGYGAPTAGGGPGLPSGGTPGGTAGAASAGGGRGPDARGGAKDGRSPPEAGAPGDKNLSGAAANLVAAAQSLKARGDAAAMRAQAGTAAQIVRQLEQDDKVDAGIRGAISDLKKSGQPVTPDAIAKAAEGVLVANGLKPEDVDMEASIARASGPPPPPVPPGAYAEAAKAMAAAPPLTPFERDEVRRLADTPPPPQVPAPRGAVDAFNKYKSVFNKAEQDFGVKPEHILGILGIETRWGSNTGKFPLQSTLKEISRGPSDTKRQVDAANQALRDSAALIRLERRGDLGGWKAEQVKGSYAGAMGIPQFLPTSWEAYARSPDGAARDPFNFGTAAYSVAHYLQVHGYSKDVARSIRAYNHSDKYVNDVLGLSESIKPGLDAAAKQSPPK